MLLALMLDAGGCPQPQAPPVTTHARGRFARGCSHGGEDDGLGVDAVLVHLVRELCVLSHG